MGALDVPFGVTVLFVQRHMSKFVLSSHSHFWGFPLELLGGLQPNLTGGIFGGPWWAFRVTVLWPTFGANISFIFASSFAYSISNTVHSWTADVVLAF